jgi:hypothetical protein
MIDRAIKRIAMPFLFWWISDPERAALTAAQMEKARNDARRRGLL